MHKTNVGLAVSLAILLTPLVTWAHHGLGGRYDQESIVEIEGEVTRVLWRNPHVRLTLNVTDENGTVVSWQIEGGSPTVLQRREITEGMVNEGDRVRVAGFASMRGRDEMIIQNILLPSGQELLLEPSGEARWSNQTVGEGDFLAVNVGDSSAPELGIFRVWSTTVRDPGSYPLYPENANPALAQRYPLTDSARAALDAFDPGNDNPMEAYCRAKGMPMIMEQPFPMEIIDHGDTIILHLEEYDTVRMVHMDQPPSQDAPASLLGHSVGRWDGKSLVVTTTRIDWPYFNQMGIPLSEAVETTERFTPTADGSRLDYELTVTDPTTFTEPVTIGKFFVWVPDVEVLEFNCTE